MNLNDQSIFPARNRNHYARQSANSVVIYFHKTGERKILNYSAQLVWELSDGVNSIDQIYSTISSHFPSANFSTEDLNEGLSLLEEMNIVSYQSMSQEIKPIVPIAFTNFWHESDQVKQYLIEACGIGCTPYLVSPEQIQNGILFFSEFKNNGTHHTIIDRENAIKIAVKRDEHKIKSNEYDLAMTTYEDDKPNHLYVPFPIFEEHDLTNVSKPFHPESMGDSLWKILKSNPVPSDEESSVKKRPKESSELSPSILEQPIIEEGRLTIGMATFDDYDGVYFTIQAIRIYHPEILDKVRFLVVDNHPDAEHGKAIRNLLRWVPNLQYIPFTDYQSSTTKDIVFKEATTEYVLCIDSHVMISSGALARLINYFDSHPDNHDLFQGPLIYDDLTSYSSSFKGEWRGGMFGTWKTDTLAAHEYDEPFEINMQGTGLMACRKNAWPSYNPRFRGFGAEEGYIHEKFRRAGNKVWCLPFLRWTHRFGRPDGTAYPNIWKDRIRNYYIGFNELNWDTSVIEAHFIDHLGMPTWTNIKEEIDLELSNPFHWFDAIFLVYEEERKLEKLDKEFIELNISHLIRRTKVQILDQKPDYDSTINLIKKKSQQYAYRNIIVIEDQATLNEDYIQHLDQLLNIMVERDWARCYICNPKDDQIESMLYDQINVNQAVKPPNAFINAFSYLDFDNLSI